MTRIPSTVIGLKTAYEIVFSPTAEHAAFIGGRDVTVLDIRSREPVFAVHPIANPSHIDFSPDGQRLVVKGTSGRTIILDAKTGGLLCDFRNQKEGEGDSALFAASSRLVVSVSWDGLFSVRDCVTSEVVYSQSYSNRQLGGLSTTADRDVFLYLINGPPPPGCPTPCRVGLHRWPTSSAVAEELPREWPAICGMHISPSGRLLALVYGTPPNMLEIYDLRGNRIVASRAWSGVGCSIAWSSDERILAVTAENKFQLLEVPKLNIRYEVEAEYPCFVQFSPSDQYLALGSWKKSFIVPMDSLGSLATATTSAQQTGCTERRDRVSVNKQTPLARRR